jgi:hypothetical protein
MEAIGQLPVTAALSECDSPPVEMLLEYPFDDQLDWAIKLIDGCCMSVML